MGRCTVFGVSIYNVLSSFTTQMSGVSKSLVYFILLMKRGIGYCTFYNLKKLINNHEFVDCQKVMDGIHINININFFVNKMNTQNNFSKRKEKHQNLLSIGRALIYTQNGPAQQTRLYVRNVTKEGAG